MTTTSDATGDQLSTSFTTYAEGIRDGYNTVQALIDAGQYARAVETFEVMVTNQQNMVTRLRTLTGVAQ